MKIILRILLLFLFVVGCDGIFVKSLGPLHTTNKKQSAKLGYYLTDYIPVYEKYENGRDSLFVIKEAYAEYAFFYKDYSNTKEYRKEWYNRDLTTFTCEQLIILFDSFEDYQDSVVTFLNFGSPDNNIIIAEDRIQDDNGNHILLDTISTLVTILPRKYYNEISIEPYSPNYIVPDSIKVEGKLSFIRQNYNVP